MSEQTPSTPADPTPQLPRPELPPPPAPSSIPPPPSSPPPLAPYYMAPPPTGSPTGRFVGVASVVAVLVVAALAVGIIFVGANLVKRTTRTTGPIDASTSVTSASGKIVFADDFHDPASGWTTDSLPSGTTFGYTANGYVVVAKGTLDHFADSPYTTPVSQIAIAVRATQSTDAPAGAGYGVSCWRGSDTAELRYDFVMTTGGGWSVDRRDGGLASQPLILKRGTSTAKLGSTPLAVTGMCATLADGHTVRLVMFGGAEKVTDITDSAVALPDAGWQADLMLSSSAIHDSVVTVTHFEVRDLAR